MTILAAQDRQSGTDNLAGLVERVTFHNSDNGFCVLRVKARGQRDLVTVVGHAALIAAGEFVQAAGKEQKQVARCPPPLDEANSKI